MNGWQKFKMAFAVTWGITRRLAPVAFGLTLGVMGCLVVEAKVTKPHAAWAYVKPEVRQALEDRANGCGLRYFGLLKNQTLCSTFAKADPVGAEVAQTVPVPKLQMPQLMAALPQIVLPPALDEVVHPAMPSPQFLLASISKGENDCDLSAIRVRVNHKRRPYFDRYKNLVCSSAYSNGLSPIFLAAQINQESGFYPWAQSKSINKKTGKITIIAEGIAQITKPTARSWRVRNVYDPNEAIPAMAKHMAEYKRTYKRQGHSDIESDRRALAAYNAGPNAVSRHGGVPRWREPLNYVSSILGVVKQAIKHKA